MTRTAPLAALCLFSVSCIMVASALAFSNAESIWVDESTQLSGLTLDFQDQWLWLTAKIEHPFAVPADRMPPVSYWLGRSWASVFGLSEGTLRGLGIVMALCALPALFAAGRLAGGVVGGVFAVSFLYTSPSFVMQTIEIRAYPIFFCLAAWATYFFVRIAINKGGKPETLPLVGLTIALTLACYTHFFGIVMSAFVFATLLADHLLRHRPIKSLLICGAAGVVMLAGVVPFVATSMSMTGSSAPGDAEINRVFIDAARLVFRTISSPVLFASLPALVIALAGLAVLAICLIVSMLRSAVTGPPNAALTILAPLMMGMVVLTIIRTQISSFGILAPHYNVWMLPLTSVSLALAFALQGALMRRVVSVAAVCLIGAQCYGMAVLLTHKSLYSHGAAEAISERIDNPQSALVIHDATGEWGHTYFPLSYLTDGQLTQWLAHPDGRYERVTKDGLKDIAAAEAQILTFDPVVRVQTGKLDSWQLAAIARDPLACRLPRTHLLKNADADRLETYCAHLTSVYAVSRRQ